MAARGLEYDPRTRTAKAPGPGGPVFSRRQLEKLRDQQAPFDARGDAHTAATYYRNQNGRGKIVRPEELQGNRELLATITVMRWDALQPVDRRTEAEARRFAWALRRLYPGRRIDWTRYLSRR